MKPDGKQNLSQLAMRCKIQWKALQDHCERKLAGSFLSGNRRPHDETVFCFFLNVSGVTAWARFLDFFGVLNKRNVFDFWFLCPILSFGEGVGVGWGGVGQKRSIFVVLRYGTCSGAWVGWVGWDGVGWGNNVQSDVRRNVMLRYWMSSCVFFDVMLHYVHTYVTLGYIGRSLACAHICHATLRKVLLHVHTRVMLRYWTFSCTWIYPRHATLLEVLLHVQSHVKLRYCTHTSCYTTESSLAFAIMTRHATLLNVLASAHTRHATLLVVLHLHTHAMLRYWTFSCKCVQ